MKIKILSVKTEENVVIFEVQLDKSEFTKICDKSQKEIIKDYKLPGFRKGCVPKALISKHISDAMVKEYSLTLPKVQHEIIDCVIKSKEFIKAQSLEITKKFTLVNLNDNNGPILSISFETLPKIENLDKIDFKKIILPHFNFKKPTNDEVKHELKNYLKKDALIVDKTKKIIEANDIAIIDFKGFIDDKAFAGGEGKNYELEIGSKSFIDNFEDQLIGLKPKDKKDVWVTFPKNYHDVKLAGKKAKFEVTINDVKSISYPKIDKKIINETLKITNPNVNSEQELITFIQNVKYENAFNEYKNYCYNIIIDNISKQAKFSHLPEGLLNFYQQNLISQYGNEARKYGFQNLKQYFAAVSKNNEDFENKLHQNVLKQARTNLISSIFFNAFFEKYNIKSDKTDWDKLFTKLTNFSNQTSEQIKNELANEGKKSYYESIILKDKLFDKILLLCTLKSDNNNAKK